MNNKQNRNKVILNITLISFMFATVFGIIIPSLMVLLSSNTTFGEFITNQGRTIMVATIIMFVLVFMFALVAFIKSKPEQTPNKKELKNKK